MTTLHERPAQTDSPPVVVGPGRQEPRRPVPWLAVVASGAFLAAAIYAAAAKVYARGHRGSYDLVSADF